MHYRFNTKLWKSWIEYILIYRKKEAKSQENPHDSTDLTGLEGWIHMLYLNIVYINYLDTFDTNKFPQKSQKLVHKL